MRLYEVRLDRGKSNESWQAFYKNVTYLKGIAPDYGGINGLVLIQHHMDELTIRALCMDGIKTKNQKNLHVEKITDVSIKSKHHIFLDTIRSYFFPHNDFEDIDKNKWL